MYVCVCKYKHSCADQRTTFGNWFSPSTVVGSVAQTQVIRLERAIALPTKQTQQPVLSHTQVKLLFDKK